MAISKVTLKTDAWNAVYDVIKADTDVMALVKRVYSAYPQEYLETDVPIVKILPMIIINPPDIDEVPVTLSNTKNYSITMDIETVVGETSEVSKKTKEISDAVLDALNNAESTLQNNGLYNFVVIGNTKDYDFREGNKVVRDTMTLSFTYFGG